jgi:circadian clock protein KaiC
MHLTKMHKAVNAIKPQVVIVDSLSDLVLGDNKAEVKAMLMRLVDSLKTSQITTVFTSLTKGGEVLEHTSVSVSSLIDTWLLVRDIEISGERNRGLYILKSRGMTHSNQIREFLITDHGVELRDVYIGHEGGLTGSVRLNKEAEIEAARLRKDQEAEAWQIELENKRVALEAQIAKLRADFAVQEAASLNLISQEKAVKEKLEQGHDEMEVHRKVNVKPNKSGRGST